MHFEFFDRFLGGFSKSIKDVQTRTWLGIQRDNYTLQWIDMYSSEEIKWSNWGVVRDSQKSDQGQIVNHENPDKNRRKIYKNSTKKKLTKF